MLTSRTDREWIELLTGHVSGQNEALEELRHYLLRATLFTLNRCLGDLQRLNAEERVKLAEDCAQDALLAVLAQLEDFRGESKFTTWIYKIGVNIALARSRREPWKQISWDAILENMGESDWLQGEVASTLAPIEHQASKAEILSMIGEIIRNELTSRQRLVLKLIAFEEIPMDVVVERLNSSRNAVYKLLHDARLKVKNQLVARGYEIDEIWRLFR